MSGKSDSWVNGSTSTPRDEIVTAAATDAVNASAAGDDDNAHVIVYGRHCELVGIGLMSWYPAARPLFGFVCYYFVPMLLIGVLYGRVVCTLLTASPQLHADSDRGEQLSRKQAARSSIPPQLIICSYACVGLFNQK